MSTSLTDRAASNFATLLSPIAVRTLHLRNRVLVSAHSYGYGDAQGLPTPTMTRYVSERAAGGAALVIIGATAVNRDGWHGGGYGLNESDAIRERYLALAQATHSHGAALFDQLFHAGGQLRYGDGRPVWAPSAVAHPRTGALPVEMSSSQIENTIRDYALAAGRVAASGFDGVELACGQGFLIHQFLSPRFNHRTDGYGGTHEKRLGFLRRTLEAIRTAVGTTLVVGVRVPVRSELDDGLSLSDVAIICAALEQEELIDYIHVSGGSNSSPKGYLLGHGDMTAAHSTFREEARLLKSGTSLPLFLAGQIRSPIEAAAIIDAGIADMVAMTRAHIADPHLVNKTIAGRIEEIRPCISCNQGCVGNSMRLQGVQCTINPATGREITFGQERRRLAALKKQILVIGGGPAGMEVARQAALRGHAVQLVEAHDRLGGQLRLASVPASRRSFLDYVRFLERELQRLRIDVRLGVEATAEYVRSVEPTVVVLACGARPQLPCMQEPTSRLVDSWTALRAPHTLGLNVLVVDGDWKQHALSLAEFLVASGRNVQVMTTSLYVGEGLDPTNIVSFSSRLLPQGVGFLPHHHLVSVSDNGVVVQNVLTGQIARLPHVDDVVCVVGTVPQKVLAESLQDLSVDVVSVGDCVFPRGLHNAVLDAFRVGSKL